MKGCATPNGPVVGWVYFAWQLLRNELGTEAPSYEWVEAAAKAYNLAELCPSPRGGVDAHAAVPHLLVFLSNGWQPSGKRGPVPRGTPTPAQGALF